ncbi:DUF1549 domain-containing protein [Urbifossiella limnaea]|uniref:Bacterial Ig-like domain (Group 2) n=1 Tax=Urbifossiella limnaea TaxID=2528023 RepID=A0A517XTL4_9BACT|nr:DUF1549 domain-containing protein [Urbifossiella limnaea]QDU20860.1 Bacterial Ig-like domain (group 2) [Urbifossiella limnaea]
MTPARLLAALAVVAASHATASAAVTCSVAAVELRDAFEGKQLLVRDGDRDATRDAKYASSNAAVATVDEKGHVTPTGDGTCVVRIEHAAGRLEIPVTVRGFTQSRAVDFRTEVMPLLSRLGCNAGGCHGKAGGQNGFRLSLFGFDAEFDHAAITREARGRRVFASNPDESLFLLKATGRSPHGGGKRLNPAAAEYAVVRRWIAAGAPASAPDAPKVVRIRVTPGDGVLAPEARQQLAVTADYSDGTSRDVTRQSEFQSNLDVVASVEADGLVTAHRLSGEAAVMARYMGYVGVFLAMVPHGPPLASIPDFTPTNFVDELAAKKWQRLGLRPSPPCDDATFLRRLCLDLCGRLPTVDETRAYLADTAADKRVKLIDRLLASPDYPAYFALRWGAILRNSNLAGADQAAVAFHHWLRDGIARNRPYDEFARGIVAAAGEWQDAPAINWLWQNRDDQLHQVTADVAQVFLGVRLQCAKCHHHPYERWGQADYYGLAGFFTRLGRKNFGQPPPYYASATPTTGERNPLTGKTPEPRYLDGVEPKFSPDEDPRHALVDWMAKADNPFFARTFVNRMWGHFLGRGLHHEVDDLRETNPPSNPELLDRLAKEFVDRKFDMKWVVRTIVTSQVYALSSEPTDANRNDKQNFARYYARRLPAEVFLDAVNGTCGVKGGFSGVSQNARAVDLPHEGFGSYFLDTFDRPKRVTVCDCERSTGATLGQVLLLANSDEIENKIADGNGRIARLVKAKAEPRAAVEELYLAALARRPTDVERNRAASYVAEAADKPKALEDVLWALLNSREFMFNH